MAREASRVGKPEAERIQERAETNGSADSGESRATNKIEDLRALMSAESAKQPVAIEETKPRVFKNDFGAVITEGQWNELQKRKAAAASAGYVIDEYSQ